VFSQIRLPSSILPSFISSYRLLSSNYDISCSRVVQQMFWTHTINEGQSKKKKSFFFLSFVVHISVYREIERLWITCFAYNKENRQFFQEDLFIFSLVMQMYIYFHHMNILHTCLLIYIYIYIETHFFFFSDNSTHSTNECKWTSMISDCLPDWNLCNHHLLIHCLSDIFYLCMYINDKVKK
jgi:hypothetical protein